MCSFSAMSLPRRPRQRSKGESDFGMRREHRELILSRFHTLVKELKVAALLPYFTDGKCRLGLDDFELIRNHPTSYEQSEYFLDLLLRSGPYAFDTLMAALDREQPRLRKLVLGENEVPKPDGEVVNELETKTLDKTTGYHEFSVYNFLDNIGLKDLSFTFSKNKITMTQLMTKSENDLIEIGIRREADRRKLLEALEDFRKGHLRRKRCPPPPPGSQEVETRNKQSPVFESRSNQKRAGSKEEAASGESLLRRVDDLEVQMLRRLKGKNRQQACVIIKEVITVATEFVSKKNDLDRAYTCLRQCLIQARNLEPPDMILAASSVSHMGAIHSLCNKLKDAEKCFKEALAFYRIAHNNRDHDDVSLTLYNLSQICVDEGDLESAADWMEEHVGMERRMHPGVNVQTIPALQSLRSIYQRQGLVGDELCIMEEVLQIQQSCLPRVHSDTAKTLNELGALFVYKGMMENAMSNFQECLEMATQLEEEELRMTAWENINVMASRPAGTDEVTAPSSLNPRRSLRRRSSLLAPEIPPKLSQTLPRLSTVKKSDCAKMGRSFSANENMTQTRESGDFSAKSVFLDKGELQANCPPGRPPLPARISDSGGVAPVSLKSLVPPARPPKPQHMRTAQKSSVEFLDPHDSSDASDLKRRLADSEIRPGSIRKQCLISSTALSERHRGDFMDPVSQQQRDVLIKILKNAANDESQRRLFFIEAQILVQLKHPNVVTLFGIVTTGAEPMIITQYFKHGSVVKFFQRQCQSGRSFELNQLLHMVMDVCAAMKYLSEMLCIVRVISSRTVYVTEDERCKITDFGLARKAVDGLYSSMHVLAVPLQWTAPESFPPYSDCSVKSDVWSFGVFMWEVLSLCQSLPYFNIPQEPPFVQLLNDGLRPAVFKPCKSELRVLMEDCWRKDAQYRPSFSSIESHLLDESLQADFHSMTVGPRIEFFSHDHFIETKAPEL